MSDAPRRVFISYSQDSDEHGARVLALAQWLREQGIDAWLDQFEDAPAQGWPMWMHEQLRDADVVLVVASQGYHDKFERNVPRGLGKGVKFESHLIVQEFYDAEARTNRFVPIMFDRGDEGFVPKPIKGHTHYVLPGRRDALRDWLLGLRPAHRQARPLGSPGGAGEGGDGASGEEPSRTPEQLAAERRRQLAQHKRQTRRGHDFTKGELVGERFELFDRVASGGFAEVWKAVDLDDGQLVAVKILHGQWCRDESRIDRFKAGAKHMDALRHPAIVGVHGELRIDEGRHLYAMPWYAGGDLHRAIREGRLTREAGLDALAQALDGLVHAHARGIVHRDVKPHNILLDAHGNAALSDFDLVLADGSTQGTRTGMGLGTILYAAPEALVDAGNVDVRADAYGAGLSALFVLTGTDPPPFVALASPQVIESLDCDARLRAAVRGAVAHDREQRTTTCADLIAAIRAHGEPAVAVPNPQVPAPVIRSARGELELVWIPGGAFMMGSPPGVGRDNERPDHRVVLAGFYLARTPVTNAAYARFLAANPGATKPSEWNDSSYNQPNQPVVGVSWHEAVAYCEWAGLVLPTEAQWEYACRAGSTTAYGSGEDEAALARVGWYAKNSGSRLHAVGELPANPFGLHDMHGNVWEWCRDGRASYAQPARAGDGLRREPDSDVYRVMRGGSFGDSAGGARSACRYGFPADDRYRFLGFRPARAHP